MTKSDLDYMYDFFHAWAHVLRPALVPGAHVMVAANPLVSPLSPWRSLGRPGTAR